MVGKLNFESIRKMLTEFAVGQTGGVHLINREGRIITSSVPTGGPTLGGTASAAAARTLAANSDTIATYTNLQGRAAIGTMRAVSALGWAVVAEIPRAEAYARVSRQRNITLVMLVALVVVIAWPPTCWRSRSCGRWSA